MLCHAVAARQWPPILLHSALDGRHARTDRSPDGGRSVATRERPEGLCRSL